LKLLILSDIHTELETFLFAKDLDYDIAVLAGGIIAPVSTAANWLCDPIRFGNKPIVQIAGMRLLRSRSRSLAQPGHAAGRNLSAVDQVHLGHRMGEPDLELRGRHRPAQRGRNGLFVIAMACAAVHCPFRGLTNARKLHPISKKQFGERALSQDVARSVAQTLIAAVAPEELLLLDELLEALERPVNHREDPLASGIGDSWVWSQMASPALIGVALWMTKDIVGKVASDVVTPRLKVLIERLAFGTAEAAKVRTLVPDDFATIATVLEAVTANAKQRGMSKEASERLCKAVSSKLQSTLESIQPS